MTPSLLEAAERAKHDLGKYIAFQARWLPESAGRQDWQDGLVSDLLQTRRGPAGTVDAVTLWKRLRPGLGELEGDPDLLEVDDAMKTIDRSLDDLRADRLSVEALQALGGTAKRVAHHLSVLHKRLRGA